MSKENNPKITPGTKFYVIKPEMFVQGGNVEQAWEVLSLALGCKISRLKYWFQLIETTVDPNDPGA